MKQVITANYHTHTTRCGHAVGKDREYVEAAIDTGIKILGFSDHSPMPFKNGFHSGFRMPLEKADDYFTSISDLKKEYKNDIDIKIGVEAEYYPQIFDDLLSFLSQFPLDYMILGQHFIDSEESGNYSGHPSNDEQRLISYVENLRSAVDTGKFAYIAHPDLLNYTGSDESYRNIMLPFLREMKERNVIFEINRLGLFDHRNYPSERFFSLCGEVGNKAIIGLDAHNPNVFYDVNTVENCIKLADKYNIEIVDKLDI